MVTIIYNENNSSPLGLGAKNNKQNDNTEDISCSKEGEISNNNQKNKK